MKINSVFPLPSRERVRVRVERSGFPLTSILSPGGERRYLLGYFLILQRHTYPIPLLTSPLKGEELEKLL
jgi:hypothetical protein